MGINQRDQIAMGESEIEQFILQSRTATVATIGPGGFPHLVAMWYGIVDGEIWIETKSKSQKVINLRRDKRASLLIEGGSSYASLRGVAMEGTAEIFEDRDVLWRVGINIYERYTAPYSEEHSAAIESLVHKRVAVKFHVERTRSWDHTKLNLPDVGSRGSTTTPR